MAEATASVAISGQPTVMSGCVGPRAPARFEALDGRLQHAVPMALRTTKTWFGVVLDAPDGPALAHFYARLLDWTVFDEDAEGAAVAPSGDAG